MANVSINGFDEDGQEHRVSLQLDNASPEVLKYHARDLLAKSIKTKPAAGSEVAPGRREQARILAERLMNEVSWDDIQRHAKTNNDHPDANFLMDDIYHLLSTI